MAEALWTEKTRDCDVVDEIESRGET